MKSIMMTKKYFEDKMKDEKEKAKTMLFRTIERSSNKAYNDLPSNSV